MNLEEIFPSKAHARVIDFLLANSGKGFSQRYIARVTGLSPSTVGIVVNHLHRLGIAHQHTLGNVKLIAVRQDTPLAKTLATIHTQLKQIQYQDVRDELPSGEEGSQA
ncbi:MAG: helix-turn-helix domain-containing protein [Nitrososphaerota archaeon]